MRHEGRLRRRKRTKQRTFFQPVRAQGPASGRGEGLQRVTQGVLTVVDKVYSSVGVLCASPCRLGILRCGVFVTMRRAGDVRMREE